MYEIVRMFSTIFLVSNICYSNNIGCNSKSYELYHNEEYHFFLFFPLSSFNSDLGSKKRSVLEKISYNT